MQPDFLFWSNPGVIGFVKGTSFLAHDKNASGIATDEMQGRFSMTFGE